MSYEFTARVRAFSGENVRKHRILVKGCEVRVFDEVAGHFTLCHILSDRTMRKLRTIADLQELAEEALRQDALNESGEPHDNYQAINRLTNAFQSILTKTQWANFESFALKAPTPEIVSYLMNRDHHNQSENQQ